MSCRRVGQYLMQNIQFVHNTFLQFGRCIQGYNLPERGSHRQPLFDSPQVWKPELVFYLDCHNDAGGHMQTAIDSGPTSLAHTKHACYGKIAIVHLKREIVCTSNPGWQLMRCCQWRASHGGLQGSRKDVPCQAHRSLSLPLSLIQRLN